MGKTFAIADLHGRHDLLLAALERIETGHPNGGTIVFTGDYVDRGPASRQIIETLMAGPTKPGWGWVCLRGNHEEIMQAGCLGMLGWWLPNGGGATLISYGQKVGDAPDPSVVPDEHLKWMAGLPVIHIDRHRVFVHAGMQATPLERQDEQANTWMLYPEWDEGAPYSDGELEFHVVHGHHQHEDGPVLLPGRSNFDTLAWWTGRLVVGVFDDDKPGGPVATIEIKGPTIHEMLGVKETA